MTITARKVLSDLEAAHQLLELEADAQRFRIIWVAAMALCRAVGHVLEKVDSKSSPQLNEAVKMAWESWRADCDQHRIFHSFIKLERDSVLKEYEAGFMSGHAAFLTLPGMEIGTLPDELFCPLTTGPYEGEDCRDILAMAISWWHIQLSEIDHEAKSSKLS